MSKGKLLLADDSVTIQKVVNLTFADEGIEVVTAGNGDLAMEMIEKQRPDIVLADVNMPGLNGYQICERLRQSEDTKDVPVVLLVGSFEPFDEDEAKRVGASGFLTKPFQSIRQLVSQVSELMEASARLKPVQDADESADEQPWSTADEPEPQTTDIDDLYSQSFADTVEIPSAASDGASDLGDAGMDDEMIEATYVSGESGGTHEETLDAASSASPFEERVSYESEHAAVEPVHETGTINSEYSDEIITPAAEPSFDETQEMPGYDPDAVWSQIKARGDNENVVRFEPAATDVRPENEHKGLALGDSDLLELPGTQSSRRVSEPATSGFAVDTPNQIANLSPELIDLIVQKVIEKMSEKQRGD